MSDEQRVYDETWRTQDGRAIRVMDMEEDHVRAVLNMILRNRRKRLELKRALKAIDVWAEESLSDDAKWGHS